MSPMSLATGGIADASAPNPGPTPGITVPSTHKEQIAMIKWRCQKDLKFLCKAILGVKDWSANEHLHLDIARHLRKPSKFKLFLLPRDHLKSTIITKAGATMRMLDNPNIRILIANNTWDNARKFLGSIQKTLVRGALLPMYFGQFESEQWNQDEITIRQRKTILDAPTIATTGLEKEQTSQHYDLIIADDLVARENARTPEQRAKVKDYVNSLMALLEPEGEIWVVGTRWSMDDAYGDLIEEGIWDVLQRGAYADEDRTIPIFPEKFSLEKLQFLRNKIGQTLFSCWYMNDPISQEAADFKKEWIKYYAPGTPHPSSLYLAVDPGLSLSRDADYSAFVVAGKFNDHRIRVVDYVRRRVVPSDLVDIIFDLVKKWKLHRVGIETFAFQKTLKYDIERNQRDRKLFFSIDELKAGRSLTGEKTINKEARIRSLQPLFEQGLVDLRPDMSEMVDELLSFPRGKYDDLIDALSRCITYLVPSGLQKEAAGDGVTIDPETGKYLMTAGHWLKNHMEKPATSIYERFMADLR